VPRPAGAAAAVFLAAGTLAAFAGLAMIGLGSAGPQVIDEFLPPIPVDTAALGRGAIALGGLFAVLGVVQVAAAIALRMQLRWSDVTGVVIASTLSIMAFSSGIAAWMTALNGFGPAELLIPLAVVLAIGGVAYAVATISLLRALRRSGRPPEGN